MSITWSPEAIDDLVSLRAYIAADSPAAAKRVALHILHCVEELLPENPHLGHPIPARARHARTRHPKDAVYRPLPRHRHRPPNPARVPPRPSLAETTLINPSPIQHLSIIEVHCVFCLPGSWCWHKSSLGADASGLLPCQLATFNSRLPHPPTEPSQPPRAHDIREPYPIQFACIPFSKSVIVAVQNP